MNRFLLLGPSSRHVLLDAPSGQTNGVADTRVLQGAIDDMAEAGGGVVGFVGDWWIQNLVIRDGVTLTGLGRRASRLNRAANSTGHGITVEQTPAALWGLVDFTIDGRYENNPDALDNIHIESVGLAYGGEIGGVYSTIERVASVWARRHNFYSQSVEGRLVHCVGSGARGSNYVLDGSDQFVDHCTSGFSDGDGFVITGLGHRVTGTKSWCAGWKSGRGQAYGYTYVNPAATNFNVSGANHQMVTCESQDAAGAGARFGLTGGNVQMHIDAAGAAANVDQQTGVAGSVAAHVGQGEGSRFVLTIGNGTSHLSPPTGWALSTDVLATNCYIEVSGSTQHLTNMALFPSSQVASSTEVRVGNATNAS